MMEDSNVRNLLLERRREQFVLFGAGRHGTAIHMWLPEGSVAFYVDNDQRKWGTLLNGVPIHSFEKVKETLGQFQVVVTVRSELGKDIEDILRKNGITDYLTASDLERVIIKDRMASGAVNIKIYQRAIQWIKEHSIGREGIINNTGQPVSYPEVTGYFIPTLIYWGYREEAIQYARWLCSIQNADGSFCGNDDKIYVFDTAQIMKGLLAVHELIPEVDQHIIKGCDWIIRQMDDDGRLVAFDESIWGDGKKLSELIHLYCLSPLVMAGDIYNRPDYEEAAKKCLLYYVETKREKILSFHLLSHFYAYVVEGLLDMGKEELAKLCMDRVAELQGESGEVPAYHDSKWTCSTGLFQFALIWYRLGNFDRGEKAFIYACRLQNPSGGWYGSYQSEMSDNGTNDYFPFYEISWANKYFLDALRYRSELLFNQEAQKGFFIDKVSRESDTYKVISKIISESDKSGLKVADVGCGRGSYLKNLISDYPECEYTGIDISEEIMKTISISEVNKAKGCLTCIPFNDSYFDVTYACESLEHAVDTESAIQEMARVTKKGGKIIVIDKTIDKMGTYVVEEWEQWFDIQGLKDIISIFCGDVRVIPEIGIDEKKIMAAWIGIVK